MSAKKCRVIGNEIFKTIVTMAYEMELANKVLCRMIRRRDKVELLMERGQTFRDDEDILKEVKRYLAISPDNKKHWRFDIEPEGGENGFVLKKEIPISVSGQYRIMLGFIKHTEYEVAQDRQFVNIIYIYLRDSDGDDMGDYYDNKYLIRTPPTVSTVEIIKQKALRLEFSQIDEAYDDIYERLSYRQAGANSRIWNRRIALMRADDQNGALFKKIRLRYGVRAIDNMIV